MTPHFKKDRCALKQRMGLLLGATALPLVAFAAPAKGPKRFLGAPRFKLPVFNGWNHAHGAPNLFYSDGAAMTSSGCRTRH